MRHGAFAGCGRLNWENRHRSKLFRGAKPASRGCARPAGTNSRFFRTRRRRDRPRLIVPRRSNVPHSRILVSIKLCTCSARVAAPAEHADESMRLVNLVVVPERPRTPLRRQESPTDERKCLAGSVIQPRFVKPHRNLSDVPIGRQT